MTEGKRYPLTAEQLKAWLHYDLETGHFTWLASNYEARWPVGRRAGGIVKDGYVGIRLEGQLYRAHRLAWLYVYGDWPSTHLDHRDTIRTHNWIDNLRLASRSQNQCNRHAVSGLKGVSFDPGTGRWRARIGIGKQQIWLGRHDTEEAAHAAYRAAAIKLHGEFVRFE